MSWEKPRQREASFVSEVTGLGQVAVRHGHTSHDSEVLRVGGYYCRYVSSQSTVRAMQRKTNIQPR